MIKFDFNEFCCGCSACFNSCAFGAIKMIENQEGFRMPIVNIEKCTECGKCEKVCPYLNLRPSTCPSRKDLENKNTYVYFSKSEHRKESASGGFVFDLFSHTIQKEGAVCGCVWDQNMEARHTISEKSNELRAFQSSKYVQSDLNNCFSEIKSLLKQGKEVVFCGTPCQTAGLHFYLGKMDKNKLTSVCLICHGVPSPKVWRVYKDILQDKYKGTLQDVNMRDKSYKGYSTSYVKYTFDINTTKHGEKNNPHKLMKIGHPTYLSDPYLYLFSDNLFLRNCCHHCIYKGDMNMADIIVGDYHRSIPEAGQYGCSSIIAMTKRGEKVLSTLDGNLIKTEPCKILDANPMLWQSVNKNPSRKQFFYDLEVNRNLSIFKKYLPVRYYIKKSLNSIGLFNLVRKLINR